MTNLFNFFRKQLSTPEANAQTDVEKISVLQKTASARRADYARDKAQAEPLPDAELALSRRRMDDATNAHIAALQKWTNQHTKQKSS